MEKFKRVSLFFIVLIIVSIIEASIIFYTHIENPSKKAAVESKKISIHLTSQREPAVKQLSHVLQKSKPLPKQKPIKETKPKAKQKSKFKPKHKPKPKPVQKKVVKEQKMKEQKQPKPVKKAQPKKVLSTPKKSKSSVQKVDHLKMSSIKSAYLKEVRELIEFNKYYPRRAKRMRQKGVVEIEFTILKDGKISNINISKRCRYNILNRAAKRTLEKIGAFKPLPNAFESDSLTLRVPINYILKH